MVFKPLKGFCCVVTQSDAQSEAIEFPFRPTLKQLLMHVCGGGVVAANPKDPSEVFVEEPTAGEFLSYLEQGWEIADHLVADQVKKVVGDRAEIHATQSLILRGLVGWTAINYARQKTGGEPDSYTIEEIRQQSGIILNVDKRRVLGQIDQLKADGKDMPPHEKKKLETSIGYAYVDRVMQLQPELLDLNDKINTMKKPLNESETNSKEGGDSQATPKLTNRERVEELARYLKEKKSILDPGTTIPELLAKAPKNLQEFEKFFQAYKLRNS